MSHTWQVQLQVAHKTGSMCLVEHPVISGLVLTAMYQYPTETGTHATATLSEAKQHQSQSKR